MNIEQILEVIKEADFCVLTCGAGMSADSGIPTYRDKDGFWRDYPYLKDRGLDYRKAATPAFIREEPALAWGMLWDMGLKYKSAEPHAGYDIFLRLAERLWSGKVFVVTSNVDGLFVKSGLREDQILEIHGNKHYLQCLERCTDEIWLNTLDPKESPVPTCPHCGRPARPNVIFFDDDHYLSDRKAVQEYNYEVFLARNSAGKGVVIEIGAGWEIPVIRLYTSHLGKKFKTTPIRVNPAATKMEWEDDCVEVLSGAKDFFETLGAAVEAADAAKWATDGKSSAISEVSPK